MKLWHVIQACFGSNGYKVVTNGMCLNFRLFVERLRHILTLYPLKQM